MSENFFIKKLKSVHIVGIGGISASAIAKHCLRHNIGVTGSDKDENNTQVKLLKNLGVHVYSSHAKTNILTPSAVIYSSAVPLTSPELLSAKEKGIKIIKRSEFLGEVVKYAKNSVAVCGSHGKTTTTSMLAEILINARINPTVFLGGENKNFNNYHAGNDRLILLEACEYKKNFLDIKPKITLVTNVDNDHLDSYKNLSEQISAVNQFIKNTVSFVNVDDANSKSLFSSTMLTYGINNLATYQAKRIKQTEKGVSFTFYAYGIKQGRINLNIRGKYNAYNALGALAVSHYLKVPFSVMKKSLESFENVKRRQEYVGALLGKPCYADYAHHPSEINALLNSVEKLEKTLIIFQPHTYSRTRLLFSDFIKVLSPAKNLIIYKTYPAREKYDEKGSAKTLFNNLNRAYYAKSINEIIEIANKINEIEKVYVIGAGDLYEKIKNKITKTVKNRLQKING